MPYSTRTASVVDAQIAKDRAAQRRWADAASDAMNASGGDLGYAARAANEAAARRPVKAKE